MATKASSATVSEHFAATATRRASHVAVRTRDVSVTLTWTDYAERARRAAAALRSIGVRRGQTVGLWLRNRPAFHVADAGTMLAGAISASIYDSADGLHAAHVVGDCGARVLVTEPAFLGTALAIRASHRTELQDIVVVGGGGPGVWSWDGMLAEADPDFDLHAAVASARPADVLTTVYTAGTGGPPKGVDLTHANVAAQIEALLMELDLRPDLCAVSGLPTATIAQRLCAQYLPMWLGWEITCCPDPALTTTFIRELAPEFLYAPPHIWRALRTTVMDVIDDAETLGELDRRLRCALPTVPEVASPRVRAALAGAGLDHLAHCLIGGAPVPGDLLAFFRALGLPLVSVYGLAETSGVMTIGRPGDGPGGHVGRAVTGCEVSVSERSEVLVRGPSVASTYRAGPRRRRPCQDAEGWVSTGDVGSFDEQGNLEIVDRIDALICTTAGCVISPSMVEGALVRASSLVRDAFVCGDARPHAVALLTLDPDGSREWLRGRGLEIRDLGALAEHPDVLGAVASSVQQVNDRLDEGERVRRFLLLGAPWEAGGEELTVTHKLRRHVIARKYAPELDALYQGDGVEPAPG